MTDGYKDARRATRARGGALYGRGIDRIVPFGQALSFGTLWDGFDLLAELTRTIHIGPQAQPAAPL